MSSSVGSQLKQARQARGLSLEQAAHSTRIRIHYLEALERDDRTPLPSQVQGRGFLRLYADYLGLPVKSLLDQWEGRAPVEETPEPAVEQLPPSPELSETASDDPVELEEVEGATEALAKEIEVEEAPALRPEPVSTPPVLPERSSQSGSAQSIFVEIGQTLRTQRETLSLSLQDVEKYTHLRLHYLKALEAGALDQLPSPVQARGMLSNYATFLNLDSEALLLRYADGLQTRRLERTVPVRARGRPSVRGAKPTSPLRRLVTPDLLFAVTLLVGLFALLLWGASSIGLLDSAEVSPTLPSVGQVLLTTPSDTPLASPTPGGTPQDSEATIVPTEEAPLDAQPTTTIAAINSDPLQVYVIARRRAFLRIIVDDQLKFNGRIIPGNAYPYSGKQRIELICGNAAAIQVFHNQQDMGSLGIAGQPVSLVFSAEGILTPTLSVTLLPTITPQATVTPQPSPTMPTPTITPFIP
ncbi:MAG: helix-turn-helix domain-containing protein [Anaerolineaceae bacterium]|nr:helix-turn-helix domain-containing protein [Anaerolineaceae bacterium]